MAFECLMAQLRHKRPKVPLKNMDDNSDSMVYTDSSKVLNCRMYNHTIGHHCIQTRSRRYPHYDFRLVPNVES